MLIDKDTREEEDIASTFKKAVEKGSEDSTKFCKAIFYDSARCYAEFFLYPPRTNIL